MIPWLVLGEALWGFLTKDFGIFSVLSQDMFHWGFWGSAGYNFCASCCFRSDNNSVFSFKVMVKDKHFCGNLLEGRIRGIHEFLVRVDNNYCCLPVLGMGGSNNQWVVERVQVSGQWVNATCGVVQSTSGLWVWSQSVPKIISLSPSAVTYSSESSSWMWPEVVLICMCWMVVNLTDPLLLGGPSTFLLMLFQVICVWYSPGV